MPAAPKDADGNRFYLRRERKRIPCVSGHAAFTHLPLTLPCLDFVLRVPYILEPGGEA